MENMEAGCDPILHLVPYLVILLVFVATVTMEARKWP